MTVSFYSDHDLDSASELAAAELREQFQGDQQAVARVLKSHYESFAICFQTYGEARAATLLAWRRRQDGAAARGGAPVRQA